MATRRDCGEDDDELRRQLSFYTPENVGPVTKTTRSLLVKKLRRYKSMEFNSKEHTKDVVACNISISSDRLSGSLDTLRKRDFQTNEEENVSIDPDNPSSNNGNYSSVNLSSLARPSIHSRLKLGENCNNLVNKNNIFKSNGFHRHNDNEKISEDVASFDLSHRELYFNNSLSNAPVILLSAGIIFFAVVLYIYLYYSYNTVVFKDPRDVFLVCPKKYDHKNGQCFMRGSMAEVQAVLAEILKHTKMLAGEVKCSERKEALLSTFEVEMMMEESKDYIQVFLLLKLLHMNPHWGVSLLDINRLETVDINKAAYLINSKYTLSWSCRISTFITDCACVVGGVVLVLVALMAAKSLHTYLEWRTELESIEINCLMEKTVDMLKCQATIASFSQDSTINPWLREDYIINTLISDEKPLKRKRLWRKALAILRKNESRITFKNHILDGKKMLMIRWMTLSSLISSSSKANKAATKSLPSSSSPRLPQLQRSALPLSSLQQLPLSTSLASSSPLSSSFSTAPTITHFFTTKPIQISNNNTSNLTQHNYHQQKLGDHHSTQNDNLNTGDKYFIKSQQLQINHENHHQIVCKEPLKDTQQHILNQHQQTVLNQINPQLHLNSRYNNQRLQPSSQQKKFIFQNPQQLGNNNNYFQHNHHHNSIPQQLSHNSQKNVVSHNSHQLNHTNITSHLNNQHSLLNHRNHNTSYHNHNNHDTSNHNKKNHDTSNHNNNTSQLNNNNTHQLNHNNTHQLNNLNKNTHQINNTSQNNDNNTFNHNNDNNTFHHNNDNNTFHHNNDNNNDNNTFHNNNDNNTFHHNNNTFHNNNDNNNDNTTFHHNNDNNTLHHNNNTLPFKCWQGSAISGPKSCHDNTATNNNISPLTKCLKVRDMFDLCAEVDDSWHQVVRNSILEKVGMGHKILQIAINSKEGCVYIRCADLGGAGEVFKSLHGWWFDGRLVTVKYIKLKRFIERFPEGSENRVALSPSNHHALSLSIPHYKSVLEDT